jgi:hypothetical protein
MEVPRNHVASRIVARLRNYGRRLIRNYIQDAFVTLLRHYLSEY